MGELEDVVGGSDPKHELTFCANGTPFYPPLSLRAVVGVTCGLSMVGAILIILSYVAMASVRTKAREILVHISLMDFMAAAANLAGVIANYEYKLKHQSSYNGSYHIVKNLCLAQASFAMYGTESSVLWTICLAVYVYLRIMYNHTVVIQRVFYFFYIFCYGLPCVLTLWFALTNKLGYSKYGGSGWCSLIVVDEDGRKEPLNPLFSNDLWIYLTIVLVPLVVISLHFYLRSEMKSADPHAISAVAHVETKMIIIPITFILLRVWSLVLIIITVEAGQKLNCTVITFFLFIGGIGDSGQGFANCIIFCLLSPKVRRQFLRALVCYSFWKNKMRSRRTDLEIVEQEAVESTCTTETDPLLETYHASNILPQSLLVTNT